ncbi:hypothetical protein REPUB_Repub04eG0233900 [Reevesia pubescens]
MTNVVTVRDFSVLYLMLIHNLKSMVAMKMKEEDEEDMIRLDLDLFKSKSKFENKILKGFWLHDDKDVDLRLARLEQLMNRRPELANSVIFRQNSHNVEQWHHRVKLFEGNPTKRILRMCLVFRIKM